MKQFEYKIIEIGGEVNDLSYLPGKTEEDQLNKYGKEGWELVGVQDAVVIFKREIIPENKQMENDQSITPTDGNDAGPAIETLENDADPATKEKELLKRVMDEFNNNIVGASMRLGMSVNVLRRKLKSYGLLPCE